MNEIIFILGLLTLIIMAIIYFIYIILRGAKDFKEDIEFNPSKEVKHVHDSTD